MTISKEQLQRLEAAKLKREKDRAEAADLAQRSITSFILELLKPIVGKVVTFVWSAISNFFANLFGRR